MTTEAASLTDESNRSLKLWSVLAYLILHRNRAVPQSEFIEVFWPEDHSANPVNALKTLLYRIRAMLSPLFGPDEEPILARRGAYAWNNALPCTLDADRFEALCRQGADPRLPAPVRMEHYRQAELLYKGDLLPKLSHQIWLVPLSVHYHSLYITAVKDFAVLLEAAGRYEEMYRACARASEMDGLDERLHILAIRALLGLGRNAAALERYETATDQLYRSLGVRPSEELRDLYRDIMAMERDLETDLGAIMADLQEAAARPGAFLCGYGFFKDVYRLEARRAMRSGACIHLCLVTVTLPDGGQPGLKLLAAAMDRLEEILVGNLRRGDVVAKYSVAQYVVMLPAANFEDSNKVMDRVVRAFHQRHRHSNVTLSVRVREIGLM